MTTEEIEEHFYTAVYCFCGKSSIGRGLVLKVKKYLSGAHTKDHDEADH
jgi:hypothetical protein